MKTFLVISVVSLLLLVSVAKCEDADQLDVDELAKIDLAEAEGNSSSSRSKRQQWDIYADPSSLGGGAGAPLAAAAVMGGGPGGGLLGGIPGGGIGGPIGGPIGGGGGGFWPQWDPCSPPFGCPRCPQLYSWHGWTCQNFCFQRKWCMCQW